MNTIYGIDLSEGQNYSFPTKNSFHTFMNLNHYYGEKNRIIAETGMRIINCIQIKDDIIVIPFLYGCFDHDLPIMINETDMQIYHRIIEVTFRKSISKEYYSRDLDINVVIAKFVLRIANIKYMIENGERDSFLKINRDNISMSRFSNSYEKSHSGIKVLNDMLSNLLIYGRRVFQGKDISNKLKSKLLCIQN